MVRGPGRGVVVKPGNPLRVFQWRVNLWVLNTLEVDGGWQVEPPDEERLVIYKPELTILNTCKGKAGKRQHKPGWVLVT